MTDIDPRDLLVDDTLSVDPVTGEEVVGPVLHGRTRRLVLRGGPGSGHFGHEGRPGQVGGSQPGDFHSAEPGSYGKGIDAAAMEVFLAGLTVVPTDADWLENWFIDRKAEADPLEKEVVVGPSGKAFDVEPFGGHESAGDNALTALGTVLSKERGVEIVLKPVEGGEFDIETYDESVGPEGDGWDRNEKGELTFQFLSHMPGERKLSPIKYFFERNEDDGKLHLMVSQSWDSVRASMLGNVATNALELSGRDPFVAWDTEEQAKQYLEAELFGKVSTFSIDVYGLPGEGRSYRFTRLPPEMLESLGLDPAKNIVPDYNWTDSRLPPFLASSVEEASDELRKYVSGRARPAGEAYRPNYGMGGVDGENALLSMGFMRISRGGLTSNSAPEIGISWNRTAGLTDAQRGVALRVVRDTIKRDGRVAWERLKGYDIERQNWGDRPGGMFSELPNNKFTAALQGQDVENWVERSSADLPAWALRLLIPRGGPGSGHFAHEGRPGQVGGSQPGDFHSAAGRPLEPIDTTWLSEHTEIPATLWNQTEDPKRIAEWLERYYEKSTDPTDEFYLTPDGVAYNVNEPKSEQTGERVDATGHGEVGYAALKALVEQKKEAGELVLQDLEEMKSAIEIVTVNTADDLTFTKFRKADVEAEEYGAKIQYNNRAYNLVLSPENAERNAWRVEFLDAAFGGAETFFAIEEDLPQVIAGKLYSYKARHDVRSKEAQDNLAVIYEAWPGSEDNPGRVFSVTAGMGDGKPGFLTADFATLEEAEAFAIDKSARQLSGEQYTIRSSIDHEEGMAAFGFIRVSRGGSGGSQVGMTIDQYLGPTPAQARFLTKIAKEAIENSGSVAWQAGRASGAIEEWPSNEFTSAMQGNFTVRSVYSLPAWAQRVLVLRGGKGSGHHGHEGREGKRGGSAPGDRATVEAPVGKDRKAQMDEAKRRKDFQSAKPATTPKAEPLGAQAPHIGPGYRVHLTNEAFAKYRAQVSSALEWASSEFKRAFGGQVEGVTIYDDSPTYVEACDPQLWSESLADKGAEFVQQVKDGLREDYGRFYGAYNHVAKAMFVNTGKFIEPSGVLDTESMTKTALHEYIHWGTVGSGRDEIWKEVEVPRAFRSAFKADYPQDLLKQEYVARVVSAELMGSDLLTNPTDTASIDMSEEDHENARVLIDKISNAFVAPNLEMPTTLRAAPPTERMVDVGIPDGLGNVWGRAIPESALDSLPDGAHVTSVYTILKGEEAFEDGRTIRPDALSLNWLDETDPARHPVRQPITKEPRPDDVTMARRSQDTVLDRVLDTIGGALRELMGMKNG